MFSIQRGSIVMVFTLDKQGYSAGLEDGVRLLLASDPTIAIEEGQLSIPSVGVALLSVD